MIVKDTDPLPSWHRVVFAAEEQKLKLLPLPSAGYVDPDNSNNADTAVTAPADHAAEQQLIPPPPQTPPNAKEAADPYPSPPNIEEVKADAKKAEERTPPDPKKAEEKSPPDARRAPEYE